MCYMSRLIYNVCVLIINLDIISQVNIKTASLAPFKAKNPSTNTCKDDSYLRTNRDINFIVSSSFNPLITSVQHLCWLPSNCNNSDSYQQTWFYSFWTQKWSSLYLFILFVYGLIQHNNKILISQVKVLVVSFKEPGWLFLPVFILYAKLGNKAKTKHDLQIRQGKVQKSRIYHHRLPVCWVVILPPHERYLWTTVEPGYRDMIEERTVSKPYTVHTLTGNYQMWFLRLQMLVKIFLSKCSYSK